MARELDNTVKLKVPLLRRLALLVECVIGGVLASVGWLLSKVFFFWRKDRERVAEVYRASTIVGDGLERSVNVFGRLLLARSISEPSSEDSVWRNLRRSLKRWMTSECPNVKLRLVCGEVSATIVTDEEGYFMSDVLNVAEDVERLVVYEDDGLGHEVGVVKILSNDVTPELVVLSDVDDTIFVSNTAKIVSMMKTSLFGNAETREIFDGVPELYQRLRGGSDGAANNPFAYVTSSPWNLHPVITRVFKRSGIPEGSMFMTDWGMDESKWLKQSNHEHKLEAIRECLSWYSTGDIVLFGDSSQHDTEIYLEVVREFGDRVKAVLIRDVTDAGRLQVLQGLVPDSAPFCFHAETSEAEGYLKQKLDSWF